ncbi:homoserine kinase [Pseudohongiella spirulinae]|uniref:Homoserine kinase n=1 Tax=Pseudohongiella spirulinae TaxID=1249552 RepID=A0A0S2KHV0_9GAMM|nr:homoserine kinase [Pseudohongiella spirulinae]ALO47551.1 Homoserine kinase [Pseudohongiella spirulinae]
MSVFTPLHESDIKEFLIPFNVGELIRYSGIDGGSENTNYFVDTRDSEGQHHSLVLTLVERGPVNELPFFIELLACLHKSDLPVPYSIADRTGLALHTLKDRPALLQPRLSGKHPDQPTIGQCAALGEFLAALHKASCTGRLQRHNDRGPDWVLKSAQLMLNKQWQDDAVWLIPALKQLCDWYKTTPRLPEAIIHGDLFRDNAMMTEDKVTGVIDFYNAATGWMLMDLAICVNDWCVSLPGEDKLSLDPQRIDALLQAYATLRPFTEEEKSAWPYVLQLAALRFWVSRQQYASQHQNKAGVLIKDPDYFRQTFMLHAASANTNLTPHS